MDEVNEVKVVAGRVAKEETNKVPLVMTPPRS
jgi:hypothetical protein